MSKLLAVEKLDKDLIFINVETTGKWYRSGDKIVEIARFYYENDGSQSIQYL